MPLVTRNSQNANVKVGTTSQLTALTFTDGDLASDTTLNKVKLYDGSSLVDVGATSFTSAAVVSYSQTIGDYSTPSAAVATSAAIPDPTPTLNTDFSSSTGWTISDSGKITISGGALNITNVSDGSNDSVTYDLTSTSDTLWVLRFKITLSSRVALSASTVGLYLGLWSADSATDTGTAQDFIGMLIQAPNGNAVNTFDTDGTAPTGTSVDGTFTTTASDTTWYVEIIRSSATAYSVSLYSDSAYTTLIETKNSAGLVSTTATLRYLGFKNFLGTDATGSQQFTIDDLIFWNATATLTTFTASKVFDDNTATVCKTTASTNPAIYVDCGGSSLNLLGIAIYLHSSTTETEIAIRASTDTTFTSGENTRTITVSNLTAGAWNYIRFNLVNKRYLQIYGNSGTPKVLAIAEIKYLTKTDSQVLADLGILEISPTDTSLALDGT